MVKVLWSWATSTFNIVVVSEHDSWKQILEKSKALSSYLNDLWITMVFSVSRWLWNARNKFRFDERKLSIREIQNRVLSEIDNSAKLSKHGNPGPSVIGVVYGDWEGRVMGTLCKSVRITTNNLIEVNAIIDGIRADETIEDFDDRENKPEMGIVEEAEDTFMNQQNNTIRYVNDAIKEGTGVSIFCKENTGEDGKGTAYRYDGDSIIGH
ncbi:hypothetical protein GIB67_000278 [Kingdonia uniflora]|uniref:Uncharacterized protein n=1 Tax=Kingdonia uniflora TaxID=39325 RepID=A0A7J7LCG7_9MAGN|nr:hypothetical protein GIB67_000278 [Kingdonia uniflora]